MPEGRCQVKTSFVVTLDAPDVPDAEATEEQVEQARQLVRGAVARSMPRDVHVTTVVMRGLPLHPFKPQHPFPTP